MRILEYEVEGQKLSPIGDHDKVVKGTINYLKARFIFKDPDWSGCKIAAEYISGKHSYAAYVDKNGCCMVPEEVCDKSFYKIRLHGLKNDFKILTNTVIERQVD